MRTRFATLHGFVPLSAALALAACTLPTKLAELSYGGESDASGATDASSSGGSPASDGGDTGRTGGDTDDVSCSEVQVVGRPVSPNVVLVLDKSNSMIADFLGAFWDHDDDPSTPPVTRWSSLHAVVESILTDFEDAINFGAHLFPSTDAQNEYNATACPVNGELDIAVAAMNKDAILAGIPAASDESLRGGTPTASAVKVALDHLKGLDPEVPRAILLVTDGAANCTAGAVPPTLFESYDESVHTIVGDAFALDGIPTYVVGVGIPNTATPVEKDGAPDGINPFEKLNELALEGGKPKDHPSEKFYKSDNQIELAAALDKIAMDALTCVIPLESPPVQPEATEVVLDGAPIAHVDDCASESGWLYTNPEGPFDAIELCGAACSGLKLVGEADITVCVAD